MAALLSLFLLQGPGEGWLVAQAPPREIKRVYWELFQTTEVWVLLLPGGPDGKPSRVSLVFQAFFPGRAKRNPSSGLPEWPKGEPEKITVRVQPFPLTITNELSLRLVVDDEVFDLGASCDPLRIGPPCQLLFPCPECAANGASVELQPAFLPRLAKARVVTGTAMGIPILLTSEDLRAVSEFSVRIRQPQRSRSGGR